MTTKNEITGDNITSKKNNDLYRDNWEKIFGKNRKHTTTHVSEKIESGEHKETDTDNLDKTKEQP